MSPTAATMMAKRLSATDLVREYQSAVAKIRVAFSHLGDAQKQLDGAFCDDIGGLHLMDRHGRGVNPRDCEAIIKGVEVQAWRWVVDRLELRQFLSISAWEKLSRDIRDGTMPELTEVTIMQMLQSFCGQFDQLLADSVREIYSLLRPCTSRLKTNSPWELGRKVVLEGWLEDRRRWGGTPRINYHRTQSVLALENVFHALDGKGQVSKTYRSQLEAAVMACGEEETGETELFRFKCFRNGNLHLEFKRKDLVFKFNQLAGSGALKGKVA